jgi:hypothetical protein
LKARADWRGSGRVGHRTSRIQAGFYAGITRIRFEMLCESQLAHTPAIFELPHLARAVKTVRDACGLIAKSGTATVCAADAAADDCAEHRRAFLHPAALSIQATAPL